MERDAAFWASECCLQDPALGASKEPGRGRNKLALCEGSSKKGRKATHAARDTRHCGGGITSPTSIQEPAQEEESVLLF